VYTYSNLFHQQISRILSSIYPIHQNFSEIVKLVNFRLSRRGFLRQAGGLTLISSLAGCAAPSATLTSATAASSVAASLVRTAARLSHLEAAGAPHSRPPLDLLHSSLPVPDPPLDVKIGQMLLIGFRGQTLTDESRIISEIREQHIGSVVLFGHNVVTPEQVRTMNQTLQAAAKIPLLIAMDQEGGQVIRLGQRFGITANYSAQALGYLNDLAATAAQAELFAKTLADLGINLNLAPVVDLNTNPSNPVIGALGRSYSADPAVVTAHSSSFLQAHHKHNIFGTLKHFPGHGSSRSDTHRGFVDVTETWQEVELEPYANLIQNGDCDVIMTAHIVNKKYDEKLPATLSHPIITGILRERLGYNGVVMSDDMQMRAISQYYDFGGAIQQAIEAGVDIISISNNSGYQAGVATRASSVIRDLVDKGTISAERIDQSYQRIMRLKERLAVAA